MTTEKREELLIGTLSSVFALLLFLLGVWLFFRETAERTTTYGIFGITIRGKMVAAFVTWLGFVALFYSIRKMVRQKTGS